MHKKLLRFRIGMRTVKTAIAVVLSMIIVDLYGATTSKLIFAMLGAMAAVQPTFKESLESCLTQIVGVLFGAVMGVLLLMLPLPYLVSTGIGIILVITLYNLLRIRFSPSLPCLIVVIMCTTPDIQPMTYALGRVWDTAIGLGVGMLINTLIFPYDNRKQIRTAMESLDQELIHFLENMFDGDDLLPEAEKATRQINDIHQQFTIFSNQTLLVRPSTHRRTMASYRTYEENARQLLAHMEVLCQMDHPGLLTPETREKLAACGAVIRDERISDSMTQQDVLTNYHVEQILNLRQALLEELSQKQNRRNAS